MSKPSSDIRIRSQERHYNSKYCWKGDWRNRNVSLRSLYNPVFGSVIARSSVVVV